MSDELSQVDENTGDLVFTTGEDEDTLDEVSSPAMSDEDKDKLIASLRKEAAGRRVQNKDVAAQLAELKALKERDMTELQKSQARLAELEAIEASRVKNDIQRKVAKAVGLPMSLSGRILGDSEADMLEDAKALLAVTGKLNKQEQQITNRGTTGSPVGTDAPATDWLRQAFEQGNFIK
jgi:hypothetical protein